MSQLLPKKIIPIEKNTDLSVINYSFAQNKLGLCVIASTPIGLCHLSFGKNKENLLLELQKSWPKSKLVEMETDLHLSAQHLIFPEFLDQESSKKFPKVLNLNLKGTPFQLQVWQALLSIPFGHTRTYTQIAQQISKNKAVRAVASSIGKNSIAYLIPCHRVLSSTGSLAGFRWGLELKKKMLEFETSNKFR